MIDTDPFNLKKDITPIQDFPVAGVQYKDVTSLLYKPAAFKTTVDAITAFARANYITDVVAADARGFIWGGPVALNLGVPLHLVRKPGKLPPPTIGYDFEYEYASTSLHMKENAPLGDVSNVLIVDDVSATGGTALAIVELLKKFNVHPIEACYASVIDLEFLGGSVKLTEQGVKTFSVITYNKDE
jgi:adenine phosphoribosyltransferase